MKTILEKSGFEISQTPKRVLMSFVVLAILAFVGGLLFGDQDIVLRSWQILLINTVFWGGLSQAGVIWAVAWQITDAKWARPFKRIGEAFGAFLPISFVMFVLVFFGMHILYEWTHTPFLHHGVAVKVGWLNMYFFVSRNIFWLLLMYGVSFFFLYASLRPDFGLANQLIPNWGGTFAKKFLGNYPQDHENEVVRLEALSRRIAPALAIIYGIGGSFLVWDFIMTLDQEWFSTLFGVFVLIGSMQAALGIMIATAVTIRDQFQLQDYMTINRLHDLAKLIFAFSLLWTYMAFSQYLVIWYADLAEETPFVIIRSTEQPWQTMFIMLFFWLFVSVFLLLLPKTFCRTPNFVRIMGIYVAIGQWLSIYLLVVPSTQEYGHYQIAIGLTEILITLGFGGAFFLCFLTFLGKLPLLPISDKHLCKTWHGH